MEFKDKILSLQGYFRVNVFNREGQIINVLEDNNLVVISGRTVMSILLAEADSNKKITKLAFANDVSEEDEELTDLANKHIITLDGYTYPNDTAVKFNWSLGFGDYNNNVITNYGLYTEDETLFAMKVRPEITKDEFIALEGEWTILL